MDKVLRTTSANGKLCSRRSGRSSSWITKVRRLAIYLRDGFACAYCGTDLSAGSPRDIGLDHLTPRVRGGGHESSNLVTACSACNFGRQDKPWTRFATDGAVQRIKRLRRRQPNVALARAILSGAVDRQTALAEAQRG